MAAPMVVIAKVKARQRQGTESLDLTLPVSVQREAGIDPGDIFAIDIETEDGIVIKYTRE